MNLITELNRVLITAIGWTLIHSLWLGSLCAIVVGIALTLLRGGAARVRYAVACAGLIAFIASLGITFASEWSAVAKKAALGGIAPVEPRHGLSFVQPANGLPEAKPVTLGAKSTLEELLPRLVLIWTAGVVLFSIRNIRAWNAVCSLRRTAESVSDASIESRFLAFAARLAIARPVKLLKSVALEIPAAIGWLRPMVILPLSTLSGLSPKELDAILIHELAHISRHDYLVNLLQVAAETLLFYHPAIWWLSCRIREEREDCCDDIVIGLQGDRTTYAKALATLEGRRAFSPQLSTAATAGGLLRRIRRIASGRREAKTWPIGLAVGLTICAGLVLFFAWLNPSVAAADHHKALEFRQVLESDKEAGEEVDDPGSNRKIKLSREVLLDAQTVLSAEVTHDDSNNPQIEVRFTEAGKQFFAKMTATNVNKQIAILSNGKMLAAPVIRQAIRGGTLTISGKFSAAEAENIATEINESAKSEVDTQTDIRSSHSRNSVTNFKAEGEVSEPPYSNLEQISKEIEFLKKEREELLTKFTDQHTSVRENERSILEAEALKQKLESGNPQPSPGQLKNEAAREQEIQKASAASMKRHIHNLASKEIYLLKKEREELLTRFSDQSAVVRENERSILEAEALKQKLESGSPQPSPGQLNLATAQEAEYRKAITAYQSRASSKVDAAKRLEILKNELDGRRAKVDTLEDELRQMRRALAMSERAIEEANKGKGELIRSLEQEKMNATISLLKDKMKLNQLKSKSQDELRQLIPVINPDPSLASLLKAQYTAERQHATLSGEFGPKHPERLRLETVLSTLTNQINHRIDEVMAGLNISVSQDEIREQEFDALLNRARKEEIELEERLQPYFRAKQDLDTAQRLKENIYLRVLQEEVASRTPSSQIPDRPE